MSFPRYPTYKDSGVAWIGGLPAHWGAAPLKYSVRLVTEKATERVHALGLENIESWTGKLVVSDSEFEGDGIAFRAGDVLFGKLRPYLAKVYVAERPGEAVGDFHVLRPREGRESRFLQYLMLTRGFIDTVDGSTFGSKMPRASWDFVGSMPLPLPPPVEQRAIAAFLDRETANIDALVAEQRRLIDLLQEKRQAVISHAVIKGLNPDAPMKDSGVEWLGEVPAHWDVRPLKHIARIDNSGTYGTEPEDGEVVRPVATTAQIDSFGRFIVEEMPTRGFSPNEVARYGCSEGDILVVKSSGSATNIISGKAGLVTTETPPFVFSNFLMRVVCDRSRAVPEFIYSLLRSNLTRRRVEQMCSTTTYPNLRVGEYVSAPLPLPSLDEQRAIYSFVRAENERLLDLLARSERACELLAERRAALMTAAVTGQIDVRGLATAETA